MPRRSERAFLGASLALLLAGPTWALNLIVNGSFEDGPAPGVATQLPSGSGAVTGWVVTPSNVDYVGTLWSAAAGSRSIGLNGSAPGGISQLFDTLPGARYAVRFYMAGDPETEPLIKTLRVAAAGQSAVFDVDITGMWSWDPGWAARVWSFNANTNQTKLEFTSLDGGDVGPSIDSITVARVVPVDAQPEAISNFGLSLTAPSPLRGTGRIDFSVPRHVASSLRIFDVAGRMVTTLASGKLAAGPHHATWDGRHRAGPAPSGIYFVELAVDGERLVRRIVLLR